MNKISFHEIYNSGIDIDELTKYYEGRKRAEEDEKTKAERKRKRVALKTALTEYLSYNNKCKVTSNDLDKMIDSIEEFFKVGEKNEKKDNYWGYTATKEGDKKWDIKFSDRVTEAERKKLRELFND